MTSAALIGHSDGTGATHMGAGSIWMVLSMIVFSLFLLAFAWSLLRTKKQAAPTPADIATERFAHGEIDADDFARILRDLGPRRR